MNLCYAIDQCDDTSLPPIGLPVEEVVEVIDIAEPGPEPATATLQVELEQLVSTLQGRSLEGQEAWLFNVLERLSQAPEPEPEPTARDLFDALDLNGDGAVAYGEVRKAFRGKRKVELRELVAKLGSEWKMLEDTMNDMGVDLEEIDVYPFPAFEAALEASIELCGNRRQLPPPG